MPILDTDLKFYSSANTPEDEVSTSGGARSTTSRPELTQLTANAVASLQSDGADSRSATITGRLPSGLIDSEVIQLNGAAEVLGAKTFAAFLKIELSAGDAARTVTLKQGSGGATRATITPNETKRHIHFQRSTSEAAQSVRYEKQFALNGHGTNALMSAAVTLTADPSSKIEIGLPATKDDSGSVANRKTAPAGITFVDDNVSQNVPSGSLLAGEAIGVWAKQTLAAGDQPYRSTFTLRLNGQTAP